MDQRFTNPLPKEKISDLSKLKVLADEKINVTEKNEIWYGKGRKHCGGKGENAGYQHFLLFPQCFQKATFSVLLTVGIVWKRV